MGDAGRAAKGLSQLTQPLTRGLVLACPSILACHRASSVHREGPSKAELCQQPWEELVASSASQQVQCPKPPSLWWDEGTASSSHFLAPMVMPGQLSGQRGRGQASCDWRVPSLGSALQTETAPLCRDKGTDPLHPPKLLFHFPRAA